MGIQSCEQSSVAPSNTECTMLTMNVYRILLIFVAEPVWGARLDRRRPRCESRIGCATLEARLSELAKAPPQCSVSPSLWCFPMLSMTMKTRVRPQATRPN